MVKTKKLVTITPECLRVIESALLSLSEKCGLAAKQLDESKSCAKSTNYATGIHGFRQLIGFIEGTVGAASMADVQDKLEAVISGAGLEGEDAGD